MDTARAELEFNKRKRKVNNHDENKAAYDDLSDSKKALYTKANDNLYIKTPKGYDEPGKPLSRLPLFHKLKEYMGL